MKPLGVTNEIQRLRRAERDHVRVPSGRTRGCFHPTHRGVASGSALDVAGVSRAGRRGAMARARAETYVTYAVGSFLACVSRVRRAMRARARRESWDVM